MIEIECDNCERVFEVSPKQAGGKAPCPHCGDVNRVPPAEASQEKELPPDAAPEQDIRVIRPAMFRAHPFRYLLMTGLLAGGAVLAVATPLNDRLWSGLLWVGLLMILAAAMWWVIWYITARLWVKLTISNKRIIRREGIIRRYTSEVLHDHVRNVEIKQTLLQRLFKVGYIGISSAGQDDIEIEVWDIPKPYEVKALIDEYREM